MSSPYTAVSKVIDDLTTALLVEQQQHDRTLKLLNEVANVENVRLGAEVARLQDELTSLRSELQSMEMQCRYFCTPGPGRFGNDE